MTRRSNKKTPLQPKIAAKLLELLSSDTSFRRKFKADPTSALEQIGHHRGENDAICGPVKKIAPKAEISAAREALLTHLVSVGGFVNPHCFEAGTVKTALRRK